METLLCSNVQGLSGNFSDLNEASSQHDILLGTETLVSDSVTLHIVPGQDASGPMDGGICTRWIWNTFPIQVSVWLL